MENKKFYYYNKKKNNHNDNSSDNPKSSLSNDKTHDPLLIEKTLAELGISDSTQDLLTKYKIERASDLVKRTRKDMYKVQGLNKTILQEIENQLKKQSLEFKSEDDSLLKKNNKSNSSKAIDTRKDVNKSNTRNDNSNARNDSQNTRNNNPNARNDSQNTRNNNQNARNDSQNARNNNQNSRNDNQNSRNDSQNNRRDNQNNRRDNRAVNSQKEPKKISLIEKLNKAIEKLRFNDARPKKTSKPLDIDNWLKFQNNDKWGFFDGIKSVIPAMYDEIYYFKDGLASVEIDEKCGYIDSNNNIVIELEYETAMSFSEGYACISKNGKCGYIDKNNEQIIPLIYDAGTPFINGEAKVKKDSKWGTLLIDGTVKWI